MRVAVNLIDNVFYDWIRVLKMNVTTLKEIYWYFDLIIKRYYHKANAMDEDYITMQTASVVLTVPRGPCDSQI